MSQPKMTKEDKEMRAKWDADALAEANVIKQDKPRLKAAKTAAKTKATEKKEEAKAMAKVAGTPGKKAAPKKAAPRKANRKKR